MGRRAGSSKKNQETNQIIDLSLKDQVECEKPSTEGNNVSTEEPKELINGASLRKETSGNIKSPRRSRRLSNAAPSSQVRDIQPVVENVEPVFENIDGSDSGEEDQQCSGEKNNTSESMEEKINNLYLLVEEQRKNIEALMEAEKSGRSQNLSPAEVKLEMKLNKYKNMYVDSQKKIKDLEEENYELKRKLECAHAKLEGYEKGQDVFNGALERFKDAFFLSSLTKVTETAIGLSSPGGTVAAHAPPSVSPEPNTQAAKRKKGDKGEASSQAEKRVKPVLGM